jgi:nicotinamide-nucleotide amidase
MQGFLLSAALTTDIQRLGAALSQRGWLCATAESCTGGLIGASLTAVPGSSAWFAGGVIAYANSVKEQALGVDSLSLERHGAVSKSVVRQMAAGACRLTGAQAAMAVSGIAGPGGGTAHKPVGTVWLGFAAGGIVSAHKIWLPATRPVLRQAVVALAVRGLLGLLHYPALAQGHALAKP